MSRSSWKKPRFVALSLSLLGCVDPGEVGGADMSVQQQRVGTSVKIPISASMVQVDAVRPALGNHAGLYDEQAAIGDPRGGTGAKPTTSWPNVVYNASAYPMGFYIDLGADYDITEVGVFDTYDTGEIRFDVGTPAAWTNVVTASTNLWESWKLFPVTQRTRYIHFTRTLYAGVNEIVIYGSPADPGGPANVPPTVSAGAHQTVVQPTSSATLTGTASDVDGTIVSRQWTQTAGPSTATLTNATALVATASGLGLGTYEFQLTVTDDDGASASSKTTVTVNAAPNGRGTTTEIYKSSSTPGGYGYVLYLPPGYEQGSNWPVVFFLHGSGQVGNGGPTELKKVREQGPQRYIDQLGKDYPFVMVSPQASNNSTWSPWEAQNMLDPFVNHIVATLKVDPHRIYMTGLSLGGAGSISYASVVPNKLAGIAAACPTTYSGAQSTSDAMIAGGLAIWSAYAVNDGYSYLGITGWYDQFGKAMGATSGILSTYTWPTTTQTAFFRPGTGRWEWVSGQTATDATGASPARPVIFTFYAEGGHSIWDRLFQDPKVWDWLLAQRRP